MQEVRFQSTPPVKAATGEKAVSKFPIWFQSTPPVKAATQSSTFLHFDFGFQSTPPVKAATAPALSRPRRRKVSIHAAREGGDALKVAIFLFGRKFQSTPPVKAATVHLWGSASGTGSFNPRRP